MRRARRSVSHLRVTASQTPTCTVYTRGASRVVQVDLGTKTHAAFPSRTPVFREDDRPSCALAFVSSACVARLARSCSHAMQHASMHARCVTGASAVLGLGGMHRDTAAATIAHVRCARRVASRVRLYLVCYSALYSLLEASWGSCGVGRLVLALESLDSPVAARRVTRRLSHISILVLLARG